MVRVRLPRISLKGRKVPGPWGITLVALAALLVGIGAGALTTAVADLVARPEPSPTPSVSPSPSVTTSPVVPVNFYPAITRPPDADDFYAGLTDLDIGATGTGNLTVVPGVDQPEGEGPVRWVRIEIEEGLPLTPDALGVFVLTMLNDERGWGANGRMTFARTDGAAEIRIVFANPETAESICPRPHEAALPDIALPKPSSDPSATPVPSGSPSPELEPSCAEQGIVVVNAYRWAAGLEAFGGDRTTARAYLLHHFLGHLLGEPDATCTTSGERASVMVDQESGTTPCLPNGWPNPLTS